MRLDSSYIYIRQQVDIASYPLTLHHTHPEHEGAVTAVGVSEDGLKVLAGTSSVSQTTTIL